MRLVEVVDYSDLWPNEYEREKKIIQPITDYLGAKIHHIGSTSIAGLPAKPIIDILMEVDDLDRVDQMNDHFVAVGYLAKGENGISERRYFEKGGENRTHQIHVFLTKSHNVIRHLAFRDYLIAHPTIANEYANLKKAIALNCNNDIESYCDKKHDFLQYHEQQALHWYQT